MTGYVWAWLDDDGSGSVHHPLVLPTAAEQIETWPELVDRAPDQSGCRPKLYRLVEVLPGHDDCTACEFMECQAPHLNDEQAESLSEWAHGVRGR